MKPRAHTLIGLVLAAVVSVPPALAIPQSDRPAAASQFTRSFGDSGYDTLAMYLDEFAVELAHRPSAFGEIVVLRGRGQPPGFNHRHLRTLRNYLVWYKNVSSDRLLLVSGGSAECSNVQLRVLDVRPATPPREHECPDPALQTGETFLYDTHAIADETGELVPPELSTDLTLLDELAACLRRDKTQRVVLIGYASTGSGSTSRKARVLEMLRERKRYLTGRNAIETGRVATVFGGYRSGCELDLHIVPPAGVAPRATPTMRPPTTKRSR